MEPSFRIEQVDNLLTAYSEATKRSGMPDLAIWQALTDYYVRAEDHEIVPTSTQQEAFDRMVKDGWTVYLGEHFYGIDYQTTDELVLEYLLKNELVTRIDEEEEE